MRTYTQTQALNEATTKQTFASRSQRKIDEKTDYRCCTNSGRIRGDRARHVRPDGAEGRYGLATGIVMRLRNGERHDERKWPRPWPSRARHDGPRSRDDDGWSRPRDDGWRPQDDGCLLYTSPSPRDGLL